MSQLRAGDHSKYGDHEVPVTLADQNQLTLWAMGCSVNPK